MKVVFASLALVFLIVLAGCSSLSVVTDFDPSQDFSGYKTYRWATAKELNPKDVLAQAPIIKKRVITGVDKVLKAKGYVLAADNAEPDFVVMAHAGTKEKMQIYNTGHGYGRYGGWYDPWWGPYGGSTHVSYYEEGSLVIDIVDWEQKELSWRGVGTGVVKDAPSDKDEAQENINEIVAKILADFPPGSKKQ